MRCSKCGYISFDHQESCRKCHKPMAGGDLKGTTYDVVVPLFLQFSSEFSSEMDVSGHEEDIVDVLDPDLDLLVVENKDVIEFEDSEVDSQEIVMKDEVRLSGAGEVSLDDDFEIEFNTDNKVSDLSFDEEDLLLDTSRFEDVPINVKAVQAAQAARPAPLEIPEGLADISDLARPASGAVSTNDLDADFDFDDLDLSFGGEKGSGVDSSAEEGELAALSLDDLDLSDALEVTPPSQQSSSLPADDDLDFDLDLGGVGEGNDASQKKGTDDLADLSLSLD